MKLINARHNEDLKDYHQLHSWSVSNYDLFWREVWDFTRVVSSVQADKAVDQSVPMNELPAWFPGARLNYAENLLRYITDHPNPFAISHFSGMKTIQRSLYTTLPKDSVQITLKRKHLDSYVKEYGDLQQV